MAPRSELQTILTSILGSNNVYFQPPPTLLMKYPCIVYNRATVDTDYANNEPYRRDKKYQVTVIDRDPDSLIPDKVGELPLCAHVRFFTSDGLNHDVFNLFF